MKCRKRWSQRWVCSVLGPLLLAGLAGCSQVRLLRDSPTGGTITIPNNTNQWPTFYRNRAEWLMHQKCPQGYEIIDEKAINDNPAVYDGRKVTEDFDYNGGYERITRYERPAYQITFRAVSRKPELDAPGPVLAPPAPPPGALPLAPGERDEKELPPPRPLPPAEPGG